MKKYFKIILILATVQFFYLSLTQAEENLNLADFPNYVVNEKSDIYPLIERAYTDILKSKLNPSLCSSIGDVINMHITLGLRTEKSLELSYLCKEKNTSIYKHFKRTYTIIFDPERKIPFDSWTNLSGMTYLVFDHNVSYEKLKLMLIHELAIFLDGKSKMLYTAFLKYQNPTGSTSMSITDDIVKVFNFSSRNEFHYAFASMRASAVEKFYLSQKLPQILSHTECSTEFRKLVDFIRNNKSSDFIKKTTNGKLGPLIDLIADAGSEKLNDSNYDEHLKMMVDPKITLNDRNLGRVSFCQYMSYPLFTNQSYYSMFSNGPRPRTGGGWGGEDAGGDSGGDASALVEKDLQNIQK